MSTEAVRTQDGYKNILLGSSGVAATFLAADAPATIPDNAQVANLSNTGGAATAVFTVPNPATYTGSSQGLSLFITAAGAPADVTLSAPSGVTINGAAEVAGIVANTTGLLYKISDTEWGLSAFTA